MLLMMLQRGEPIHSVVWFDTGWEFPEMQDHIDKLEHYVGFEFVRLKPKRSFYDWMFNYTIYKGKQSGRHGVGWPSPLRRWCTREKTKEIKQFVRKVDNPVQCIGYAADEAQRKLKDKEFNYRFPLQEYNITEQQALAYCMKHGFDWSGLYEVFNRVSCFCCPLQRLSELRKLRRHYPELWSKMLEWDQNMPDNRGFKGYKTVNDLEQRFQMEDKKLKLPWGGVINSDEEGFVRAI